MRTKRIVAGVGLIVVLLLLGSIVFIAARPSAPAITVRHVDSVRSGHWINVIFEITNHTPHPYIFVPLAIEVRNGAAWKKYFDLDNRLIRQRSPSLEPYELTAYEWDVMNLEPGCRLRLRLGYLRELSGLDGVLRRLKLWHRLRVLNPFDKHITVYSEEKEIVSDEFIEPDSNHAEK